MCRAQNRAVAPHDRLDEVQGNHRKNEQREKDLASSAPRQQSFEPRADKALQSHIQQQKKRDHQQHRGQNCRFRCHRAQGHGNKPTDGCKSGKIGQSVGQADHVKRGEIQRKTQQGPEFESCTESRSEYRKQLPENKNAPEKQTQQAQAAHGKKVIGTGEKSEAQPKHEEGAHHSNKNQADQIKAIAFPAETVAKQAPAQAGHQTNLGENPDGNSYISHESSSRWGRSVPSWPTMERKTCSSVVLPPASPEIPARSSSSEP